MASLALTCDIIKGSFPASLISGAFTAIAGHAHSAKVTPTGRHQGGTNEKNNRKGVSAEGSEVKAGQRQVAGEWRHQVGVSDRHSGCEQYDPHEPPVAL